MSRSFWDVLGLEYFAVRTLGLGMTFLASCRRCRGGRL